jgi:hypothetical protein
MVPVIDAADGRWLLTSPVTHLAHVLLYCYAFYIAGSRWCPLLLLLTAAGC